MRDPIICWVILLFYLGNSAVTFVSTETILGVEKKSFRPQNQNGSQNSEPKYDEPVHKTWEVKQQEILKRLYNFLKKLQELEKKNHSMVKRNTSEIHSGHIFDKIYDDFKKNQFLKKIDAIKSISKFDEEDRGKKLISTDDVVDILTRKIAEMATKNLNNTGSWFVKSENEMMDRSEALHRSNRDILGEILDKYHSWSDHFKSPEEKSKNTIKLGNNANATKSANVSLKQSNLSELLQNNEISRSSVILKTVRNKNSSESGGDDKQMVKELGITTILLVVLVLCTVINCIMCCALCFKIE